MLFDGQKSHVEAPLSQEIGGDAGLTVMARVRRSASGAAWDRLIDFGNGMEQENIVINFQNEMMYEVRGADGKNQSLAVGAPASFDETGHTPVSSSSTSRSGAFPENEWIHVSLVHAADGTASIFWDGACKASGKVWLPQRVHREKYYVGRSHWQDDPYFNGEISDVHIFDYALSKTEVNKCVHSRSLPTGKSFARRPENNRGLGHGMAPPLLRRLLPSSAHASKGRPCLVRSHLSCAPPPSPCLSPPLSVQAFVVGRSSPSPTAGAPSRSRCASCRCARAQPPHPTFLSRAAGAAAVDSAGAAARR